MDAPSDVRMMPENTSSGREESVSGGQSHTTFLGLTANLWRVALVVGISQLSIALWKWEYSIFLLQRIDALQMGLVFSVGTAMGLIGSFASGAAADFVGRRRTLAAGFIPLILGLLAMSYFPVWPLLLLQYGFIWYGVSVFRVMSRTIPADEVVADHGRNPARKMMMVTMPLWLFDAFGPLIGAFMMSLGFSSQDLYRLAAWVAASAMVLSIGLVKESLPADTVRKARAGPRVSFRNLGGDYWRLCAGMAIFYFFFTAAIQYLGNLCTSDWQVDTVTYGLTWSAFSFTSALLMYTASSIADRNLKGGLLFGLAGNGVAYIVWALGSGAFLMYLLNITWAVPLIIWVGAERSLAAMCVGEEVKGRALGTYELIMGLTSIFAVSFGALVWTLSGSLRIVWGLSGLGMIVATVMVYALIRGIDLQKLRDRC